VSGLAACWHRDGRPVGAELERMMATAAGRGRDGQATWREGPVGLGQLHRITSSEEEKEAQPKLAVDAATELAVVMHGHVHEQAELRSRLGISSARPLGEAELLLRAYQRWGIHLLRRVVGDLAVVIFDGRARRLVALTDHLGFRPLVWWADGRHVLVASEVAQLMAHGAPGVGVNEAFLAEAYANRLHTPGETLLAGVRRLPAGHALVVDATGPAQEQRWGESPLVRPAHRRTDDWIEEYRTTFAESVRVVLDTSAPPTVTVSGGLDSSSILCTAAQHGWLHPETDVVTYDVSHPGGDDAAYTDAIAATTGLTIQRLALPAYDWPRTIDAVQRQFTLPMRGNAALHRTVIDRTVAAGRSVVITGEGGDEWLNYMSRFWPDRMARGQVDLVLRAARAQKTRGRVRGAARAGRAALVDGVGPLVGRRLGHPAPPMSQVPIWIAPEFARRAQLADRLHSWHPYEWRGPVFQARYAENHGGVEMASADAGVEYRHPFHDRRLVELMFAMPEELTVRNGTTKWILRQAMQDTLPPVVAQRPAKGHLAPYLERGLRDVLDCLGGVDGLGRLLGVQHGCLDQRGLTELATRSLACAAEGRMPVQPIENMTNLWAVLAADIWLSVRVGLPPPVPLDGPVTPRLPFGAIR
jgi:asparagine synthase (glutamine-hydrolysing)